MATLYIAEFAHSADDYGHGSMAVAPPLTEQTVAIGGSSTQSAAFQQETTLVRVHTDAICSILIGSDPTATAAKSRMAAGDTEYYAVKGGHKIAVITNS